MDLINDIHHIFREFMIFLFPNICINCFLSQFLNLLINKPKLYQNIKKKKKKKPKIDVMYDQIIKYLLADHFKNRIFLVLKKKVQFVLTYKTSPHN